MDILDITVPREILDRLLLEPGTAPLVEIVDLGEDRRIASLNRIPAKDAGHYIHQLRERGYKTAAITLGEQHVEIVYFTKLTEEVREAIALGVPFGTCPAEASQGNSHPPRPTPGHCSQGADQQ